MQETIHPLVTELMNILSTVRQERGISQEDLAAQAGIHRTYLGLLERNERNPTLSVAFSLCNALGYSLSDLVQKSESIISGQFTEKDVIIAEKARQPRTNCVRNEKELEDFTGVNGDCLLQAIQNCYHTLDTIDGQLMASDSPPISRLVELANLSSMVGNLIGAAFANSSNGLYERNKPHHYPDLLPKDSGGIELELKMALETNRPKGHLPKPGNYITFRYVLGDRYGNFKRGVSHRGDTVWIWEVKIGSLKESDFDVSDTSGDSGKTANIKNTVFHNMKVVYFDPEFLPYAGKSGEYPGIN